MGTQDVVDVEKQHIRVDPCEHVTTQDPLIFIHWRGS